MNKPLRHVALVLTVLFLLLFGSTTYFQIIKAPELSTDSRNARMIYNEVGRPRGPIVVAGVAVASTSPSNDKFTYQRSYLDGKLYAPVTGYNSLVYGFSGIEKKENDLLSGKSDSLFYQRLASLISGSSPQGASVELTIDSKAQEAAYAALGDRKGAVVALDPETGAVLAMVSTPSYDPNLLASHNSAQVRAAWKQLTNDPSRPMVNRAIAGDLYPPGSTFKLIVAAAALDSGKYTADSVIPGPGAYTLPNSTSVMSNHPGGNQEACGPNDSSSLQSALMQSCNTSFALLGESLGEDAIRKKAQEFGFGSSMDIPLKVTPSTIGSNLDQAQLAMSSIGQYEDKVTPMQMAMVAASFANDGVVMEPQLVKSVHTSDLHEVQGFTPVKKSQPLSATNAAQMRHMMEATVESGTATEAQISGATVGGKTGTAQWDPAKNDHSWFVGYAIKGDRKIAVAVIVEQGGYGSAVATPVAHDVMQAFIEEK